MTDLTGAYLEHVTVAGDRWDLLAWDYYGDAHGYERIVRANPGVARGPLLPVGVRIAVPVIARPVSAAGLPPWKRGAR